MSEEELVKTETTTEVETMVTEAVPEPEPETEEEKQKRLEKEEKEAKDKKLREEHIQLSKDLVDKPYDELPQRVIGEEEQKMLHENFDVSKKLRFVTNRVKYKDGTDLTFKFDETLLKKSKEDIQFCHAIKGALSWGKPDLVQQYLLEYIKRDFDDDIKEVHVLKSGKAQEKDVCMVLDPRTHKQLLWIKFLREEITDEMWQEMKKSHAGTDSVVINQSVGRDADT